MGEKQIVDIIKSKAKEIEEELVSIRHELHKHPELGVELHETHDIISRELHKIPELEVQEHKAGGSGVIAILHGGKPEGKTVLLRADIDALPIEEEVDSPYKSEKQGCITLEVKTFPSIATGFRQYICLLESNQKIKRRFQDYTVLYINLMTAFWQMHQVYLQCLGIRDAWEC